MNCGLSLGEVSCNEGGNWLPQKRNEFVGTTGMEEIIGQKVWSDDFPDSFKVFLAGDFDQTVTFIFKLSRLAEYNSVELCFRKGWPICLGFLLLT